MDNLDPHPCGPESWKAKLPGWAHAPQFVYRSACRAHDSDYDVGGTPTDRKIADDAFYGTMKDAIAQRPGIIQRMWLRYWAWVYMRAVRQRGDDVFHYITD